MSRRPRKERDVFSDRAISYVLNRINVLEMQEMTTIVEPRMAASDVLEKLFPEQIDLLRAAGAIAADIARPHPLQIVFGECDEASMLVNWGVLKTIAPAVEHPPLLAPPVINAQLQDMLQIVMKWERVRKVFSFLNSECKSVSGFRNLWPCIVALAHPDHNVHTVNGKKNMACIGAMLADIRDTQATVAGALLLAPREIPKGADITVRIEVKQKEYPYGQYFRFA